MGVVPLLQGGQRLLQVGDKGLGALQAAVDADDALVPPELCALFRTEPRVGDEDQALEPAPGDADLEVFPCCWRFMSSYWGWEGRPG